MLKLTNKLSLLAFLVASGCALAALGSGLGYRFGWWHFRAGIAALGNVFWVAVGAALASIIVIVLAGTFVKSRRALVLGLAGLAIAGITAWVPYNLRVTANALPPIHDISTDLVEPPQFVRVAALRKADDHPVAYDGPQTAKQQQKAYPDILPLVYQAPHDKVFAAAKAVVESMGLELVDADPAQGRIEATETSVLFGFKDDIVVRIASGAEATKVDVRSKSRVGRNDFGMNAKRIRTFQSKLNAALH